MTFELNPEKRQLWLNHIEQWKASGKNASQWCHDNQIHPKTFYAWRSRLGLSTKTIKKKLKPNSFVELPKSLDELEIECNGLTFKIKNFEEKSLLRFLQTLKRL